MNQIQERAIDIDKEAKTNLIEGIESV